MILLQVSRMNDFSDYIALGKKIRQDMSKMCCIKIPHVTNEGRKEGVGNTYSLLGIPRQSRPCNKTNHSLAHRVIKDAVSQQIKDTVIQSLHFLKRQSLIICLGSDSVSSVKKVI